MRLPSLLPRRKRFEQKWRLHLNRSRQTPLLLWHPRPVPQGYKIQDTRYKIQRQPRPAPQAQPSEVPRAPIEKGTAPALVPSAIAKYPAAEDKEPPSGAKSIRSLFRLKAAEGGGEEGSLDQTAFRQLVKVLLLNEGGSKSVPPDKDIDAAFECEDVQHIGRIDEEDFLELYELIRSGKAKGLGSHSMVSSKYEKKRAEARRAFTTTPRVLMRKLSMHPRRTIRPLRRSLKDLQSL